MGDLPSLLGLRQRRRFRTCAVVGNSGILLGMVSFIGRNLLIFPIYPFYL